MQETDLSILARKYQERIQALENDLNEEKRKFNLVSEMIELLRKEGISYEEEKLFDASTVLSHRYKDMSMTKAIFDILKSREHKQLSANDVYQGLVKNDFTSRSKNLKRDVYTRLLRLEQNEKIGSTKKKKGQPKRYFLLKTEEDKKATEPHSRTESSTAP